jgi:hypothetical protein
MDERENRDSSMITYFQHSWVALRAMTNYLENNKKPFLTVLQKGMF